MVVAEVQEMSVVRLVAAEVRGVVGLVRMTLAEMVVQKVVEVVEAEGQDQDLLVGCSALAVEVVEVVLLASLL